MIDARILAPTGWTAVDVAADVADAATGSDAALAVGADAHGIRVAPWRVLAPDPASAIGGIVTVAAHVVHAPTAAAVVAWCGELVAHRGAHRADPSTRVLRWSDADEREASVWSLVTPDDRSSTRALLVRGTVRVRAIDATTLRTCVAAACAIADTARIAR